MEEIIPGLWIGDLACALATDYLSLAGVTHIVTAMKQSLPSPMQLPDGRKIEEAQMYHVSIDDLDDSPILVHLPGAVDFIDEAIEQRWIDDEEDVDGETQQGSSSISGEKDYIYPNGRRKGQWATMGSGTVLVHCQAGISRSVAIVAAYLMKVRSMSLASALEIIQTRRTQADPNPGFRLQLELYESAGCNVDVRNQRIRRYLMSHSSILKGDPIDDVLLSYYPSPFHSPAGSSTGIASNGLQNNANLHFSSLDEGNIDEGSCTRSGRSGSQASSASISPNMSRQGSRAATAAAAANRGAQRQRGNLRADGTSTLDLSKSPSLPPNASELFDNIDEEKDEDPSKRLIKEQFSSVKEDHEVLITISKGNLPGGVKSVKGNQGKANGDVRLPKPHFRGLKLRCKMCRWELAARDHVVEHEAGRGKDAFDVRKREKDTEAKSKDGRLVRELGIEERFGAQTRIKEPSSPPPEKVEPGVEEEEKAASIEQQQQQSSLPNGNSIRSAASLSAQLPPHLAALRQGRAGQITSSAPNQNASSSPPHQRKMLHSSQCSSYFTEPLAWMSALKLGEVAGRLDCPNARCGAKLGSWDWAGMQCACGAWVTPAFALHKSKVDEI